MKENVVQEKSYAFASRIIKAYKYLVGEQREFVLSKQLLRSGTSIGANVEEALAASSTADFVNKLNIAAKEARETSYWLRLLHDNGFLPTPAFHSGHSLAVALVKHDSIEEHVAPGARCELGLRNRSKVRMNSTRQAKLPVSLLCTAYASD